MNLRKILYKSTYKKSKEKWELITIIAIVTAAICVFFSMRETIKKSYSAQSLLTMNADAVLISLDIETEEKIKDKIEEKYDLKYSFFRTDSQTMFIKDSSIVANIVGAKDDFVTMNGIEIVQGDLPKNSDEVMLDQKYNDISGEKINTGDKISLITESGILKEFKVVAFINVGFHNSVNEVFAYTTIDGLDDIYEDFGYNMGVCTYADTMDEINECYTYIYDTFEAFNIPNENIMMNTSKYNLYQDEVNSDNEFGKMFDAMAYIVLIVSIFLIYNAIEVTSNEKTVTNALFRCIGLSNRKMNINLICNCSLVCLSGVVLGWLLGFLSNHTIGTLITDFLNRVMMSSPGPMESGEKIKLKVYDSVYSYLKSGIVVFAVSYLAYIVIIIKNSKKTVIECLNGSNNEKNKTTRKMIKFKGNNVINLLGDRNIKRNKTMYAYTLMTLLASLLLLLVVATFFANLSIDDIDSVKKALFCDYEFVLDGNKYLDADIYKELVEKMDDDEIKGASYDSILEYFQHSPEEYNKLYENSTSEENKDLQYEYLANIYITGDNVIKDIAKENNINISDYDAPLVFSIENDIDEVTLYDIEEKEYKFNITGTVNSNYFMDFSYLVKVRLIMNETAAKEYLGCENKYNRFMISSEKSQQELQSKVNDILNKHGIQAFVQSTQENIEGVENQKMFFAIVALYLMLILTIMALFNCYSVMKIIVKQRKSEYGIVMAMGMSRKKTASLITYEISKLCVYAIIFASFLSIPILMWWFNMGQMECNLLKSGITIVVCNFLFYMGVMILSKKVALRLINENVIVNINMEE